MQDIKIWEEKIKERRKNTDFRDFLKEICSWYSLVLYNRDGLISKFPKSDRIKNIIHKDKFFGDYRDTLLDKGISFDFDKNFFENYRCLTDNIDFYNVFCVDAENADYGDNIFNTKNVYLSNGVAHNSENILYSFYIKQNCTNVLNSFMVWSNSTNVYFSAGVLESYNIFYSRYIYNSNNIWFSNNLNGCSECIFCDNLDNKKYFIKNIEYSREEYLKMKLEILKSKEKFLGYYMKNDFMGKGIGSSNSNGNFLLFCENVDNGYFCSRLNKGRNAILIGSVDGNADFYDCIGGGSPSGTNYYGTLYCGTYAENLYLTQCSGNSQNLYYCLGLQECSFCLGCIGLKNKSFCILNKQYSKEEWYELANKIFSQMDSDGVLGDFFPGSLNPFYFNDTMAYLIDDSFTKEEAEKEGYMWRKGEIKVDIPENCEIVETKNLSSLQGFDSSGNWQINPEIMKKVIKDEKGNIYKIVPMEYEFLMKHSLPLPEIHWLDRIKLGFKFK